MKQFAVFDIRLRRPGAGSGHRGPDPALYGGDPAVRQVAGGILPCAGAVLRSSNLLLR